MVYDISDCRSRLMTAAGDAALQEFPKHYIVLPQRLLLKD
jgi:hypothetical protein